MDAIWFGVGVPVAVVVGYFLHALFDHYREKPVSKLIRFTPQGIFCIGCFQRMQSLCNNSDCAYKKYEYVCSIIRGAEKSIDFCVPLCSISGERLPFLYARKRGIPVRVIFDGSLSREGIGGKKVISRLQSGGCSVRFGKKSQTMHHKFTIVDHKILILCTQSWTLGGFFCNFENIEITNCKDAVKAFSDEFQYLWNVLE